MIDLTCTSVSEEPTAHTNMAAVYVTPKRYYTTTGLHCALTQNIIVILVAMKTFQVLYRNLNQDIKRITFCLPPFYVMLIWRKRVQYSIYVLK
jgi:hypothetical protein